ncbi:FMN-binding protein [Faecalibacterium duncaniae]|uniref:FMN-binding protein n=1 Tax=Faecalibacterium duncaniae (strain DSM 17677 / JCM 31915 / A2-165) TaxID=411483 RepID=UPI00164CAF2E|nr:FMN-binding protein [Faecalibacterium duncaniae]MBC5720408.1 FMN-binding protein [Faecalibacterium duncaniae]
MKYKNFFLRAVNLLLILGVLWQYQQVALVRAAAVSQRKQEIAEVEAYNASVLQAQAEQTQSGYRDGTYEGSAFGFGDVIRVSVTIRDGKMTDIAVLDASGEDKPYYKQALPLLDEMLEVQSAEVDTVSGATLTAEGLIGAVEDALGKAAG